MKGAGEVAEERFKHTAKKTQQTTKSWILSGLGNFFTRLHFWPLHLMN